MGEGLAIPTDPHHTPTFIQPSPQSQKTQKPRRPKKKDTSVTKQSSVSYTTKTTQANEIASLKRRAKKLEKKDRSRTHKLKRLYKVGLSANVESSRDEEDLGEDASKQGRITDIDADDKGKGIMIEEPMVEQVKPMKRLEQMRLDEELAFKLQKLKKKKKAS
ncbi:hypothetical protein Tco_1194268 [Tanacetum coccineum]